MEPAVADPEEEYAIHEENLPQIFGLPLKIEYKSIRNRRCYRLETESINIFEKMPVKKAVLSLALPTVISQIITVVYGMADTFFIGQMNDPDQVAAATLAMPPFILLTAIANLFGIGGSSLFSRSMGAGENQKAKRSASFAIWTAAVIALIYGLVIFTLRPVLFPLLGADASTYGYCTEYVFWTITLGSVPTVLSACLAHFVRAEGYSKQASLGVASGGILNIILDPIFIFGFCMGVTGAAVATMLSNFCSMFYFILLITRKCNVLTLSPRFYSWKGSLPRQILLGGLPSFFLMLMNTVSNLVLNKLVVSFSNQALAGMGIAKRLDGFVFAIHTGMSQGVLSLIAYNFSAGNGKRMKEAIKTAFLYTEAVSVLVAVLLFICAVPVSGFFINDAETIAYGSYYLRIVCITGPSVAATMMIITVFQATGQQFKPLILSLLRKGGFDIPAMFLLNCLVGVNGIPWSSFIADLLCAIVALILFFPYLSQINRKQK